MRPLTIAVLLLIAAAAACGRREEPAAAVAGAAGARETPATAETKEPDPLGGLLEALDPTSKPVEPWPLEPAPADWPDPDQHFRQLAEKALARL